MCRLDILEGTQFVMNYASCETYLSKHLVMALFILIALTAAVYSGSLRNGFVWDDHDVVENYPLNSNINNLPKLFALTDNISYWPKKVPYYRPLARAIYVVDRQLFGLDAWCYHAENLVLHLANVLLLFLVARSLFLEILPSLFAASIFAIHPGISEPVFAVFARNSLLSLFFIMATLLTFRRGLETKQWRWFLSSAALFFLGLLSKESTIMVMPLIGWFMYAERKSLKFVVRGLVPLLAVLIIYWFLRNSALVSENIPGLPLNNLTSIFTTNMYIVPRYLLLVAWPAKLTNWHEIPANLHGLTPFLVSIWIVVAAGTVVVIRFGGTAMKFGLLWGVCLLIPVLGIWPVPGAPMAERHLYGPFAGFSIMAAALGLVMLRKRLVAGGIIICIMFALLAVRTTYRSNDWFNDISLFAAATKVNPDSVNAHYNLGDAYEKAGNMNAALYEYLMVIQLSPNDIDALEKIGTYYFRAGRYEEALPYFERAVALHSDTFGFLNNLGSTYDMLNRKEEAIHHYELALQAVPLDNLAEIARLRGRIEFLRGEKTKKSWRVNDVEHR